MSSRRGGTQGGDQGARVFSPAASLARLPESTRDNIGQGGKENGQGWTRKRTVGRSSGAAGEAPSLAVERARGPAGSLQSVAWGKGGDGGADRTDALRIEILAELPLLTPGTCRALLAILRELTTIPVLDRSSEVGNDVG